MTDTLAAPRTAADRVEAADLTDAGNVHSPARMLAALAQSACAEVRLAVSANPSTPAAVLAALSRDPSRAVREQVYRVARTIGEPPTALDIACAADADPADLAALSEHPDHTIRMRVAAHPNTPAEALEALCANAHWCVRDWAATNPRLPGHCLMMLAEHDDVDLSAIARHPNAPVELLQALLEHDQWAVREAAGQRLGLAGIA